MKIMHHIGNVVIMHSLFRSHCLAHQTKNMTAIPRIELLEDKPYTRRFEIPYEISCERMVIFQTIVYAIQAEPEATAEHVPLQKNNIY